MSDESRTDSDRTRICNARVVTPDGVLDPGSVVVEGERIAAVEADPGDAAGATAVDADGRLVLPGLIDLHGDDVERHLFPSEGVAVPVAAALAECDRANVAAGVTTKFHAIAFEDAPDENRSTTLARRVVDAVSATPGLLADNRAHVRCEVGDPGCAASAADALDEPATDLVSIMNHVPGAGQFADTDAFARRYVADRPCTAEDAERVVSRRRRQDEATRARRIGRVLGRAADAGVPAAAHDLADADAVAHLATGGVTIVEYPVTAEAARAAADCGLVTAMGAPNLVFGGSRWGNLDARDAIEDGVVDVLCSDYHPGSMLRSVFVDTGESLVDRVARVSSAPAAAAGLDDRGRIECGARADLLIVDPDGVPVVETAYSGGDEIYRVDSP